MQASEMKVGGKYEFAARDATTGTPVTVRFTIIEVGWYPSRIKPGLNFYGAVIHVEGVEDDQTVEHKALAFAYKVKKSKEESKEEKD